MYAFDCTALTDGCRMALLVLPARLADSRNLAIVFRFNGMTMALSSGNIPFIAASATTDSGREIHTKENALYPGCVRTCGLLHMLSVVH